MEGKFSRCPNPEWPNNDLKAIKEAMKQYQVVLVPPSFDIRMLLLEHEIEFTFVLPSLDRRNECIWNYQNRGNEEPFIEKVITYFDEWSRDQNDYPYPIVLLKRGQYLEDWLIEENILS